MATPGPQVVFTFATTHEAMAAEDVLQDAGIAFEVVPPPRELTAGCGLALRVSLARAGDAVEAMQRSAAPWEALHELGPGLEVVSRLG